MGCISRRGGGCRHWVTVGVVPLPHASGLLLIVVGVAVGGFRNNLTSHIQPFSCADVNVCVTMYFCFITATIDVADGADGKCGITTCRTACYFIGIIAGTVNTLFKICTISIRSEHNSFFHVHIDMRTANHQGLVATAVDGADTCGRDDVDLRITVRGRQCAIIGSFQSDAALDFLATVSRVIFLDCFISAVGFLLESIDRVGGIVTAAVQFVDEDGLTAFLLDIDDNRTVDGAGNVVSAEDLVEGSVGDVHRHTAVHVGILGTAVHDIHILHTVHLHTDVAVDLSALASTIGRTYVHRTGFGLLIL